jgi:hypothetical protein
MNARRVRLPPISGLLDSLPTSPVVLSPPPSIPVVVMTPPSVSTGEEETDGPAMPYSVTDDLFIFRFVSAYYGGSFHGKISWSFWDIYKRITGCTRSTSSLYHHWNGAVQKKYGPFITGGRLAECLAWLESAVGLPVPAMPHAGAPLQHHHSQPPTPLGTSIAAPRGLVRTPSFAPSESQRFLSH